MTGTDERYQSLLTRSMILLLLSGASALLLVATIWSEHWGGFYTLVKLLAVPVAVLFAAVSAGMAFASRKLAPDPAARRLSNAVAAVSLFLALCRFALIVFVIVLFVELDTAMRNG